MVEVGRLDDVLRRGWPELPGQIAEVRQLDEERRTLTSSLDSLRAERNAANQRMAALDKKSPEFAAARDTLRELSSRIKADETRVADIEQRLERPLMEIPNAPHASTPDGAGEADNPVVEVVGDKPSFSFKPRPHWEIGEALGILDIPRGAKLSGSRFYILRGAGAALQRALITWMIDLKIDAGLTEIYPPFVTRKETLIASAHLPHFDENLYRDDDDDVWLVPTAEPQLISQHRDETIPLEKLPLRYVAYTACFRREKMSAGRDVRGIKRGHQFDKVEMVSFTLPEDSPKELDRMTQLAVDVIEKLELPVRVVERCAGDLGFTAMKGYDVETWGPGVGEWLEVSSTSDGGSLQADRGEIRFKREAGGRPEHPHILNASGVALPRLMISIIENYQQQDGSLVIPKAVRPYMRGRERIAPGEFAL